MDLKDPPVRILIVDDDAVCGELLMEGIEQEGVEVVLASDGLEALERLQESDFDILISDLHMPRMDGLSLLKHARERHPHILSIIITGFGSLETAIEAIRLGAYDYVQKPFKVEEIAVTARNAIEKVKILRERTRLIQEVELLHEKVRLMESVRDEVADAAQPADDKGYWMLSAQAMPLCFLEAPQGLSTRIWTTLESLKDLRREGLIDEMEFSRLRRGILERIESGKP